MSQLSASAEKARWLKGRLSIDHNKEITDQLVQELRTIDISVLPFLFGIFPYELPETETAALIEENRQLWQVVQEAVRTITDGEVRFTKFLLSLIHNRLNDYVPELLREKTRAELLLRDQVDFTETIDFATIRAVMAEKKQEE